MERYEMKLIDLTHTIEAGMPAYPGEAPEIVQTAQILTDGYNEYRLSGGLHVGTHVDAPAHMLSSGAFISDMPITKFFGRGRLIDARGHSVIRCNLLAGIDLNHDDIVLVLTGWSKRFGCSNYYSYESFPKIDIEFARQLVVVGISMLGIDTPSPDDPPFDVHKLLLSQNILIIENLTNLESLLNESCFEIVALPSKLRCDAGAIRVVARID
jgi:kynurenine formamidase